MIICFKCRVEMDCVKTGVAVDFGCGHCYAGDRFQCPRCKAHIVRAVGVSHYDPDRVCHDEYIEMKTSPHENPQ